MRLAVAVVVWLVLLEAQTGTYDWFGVKLGKFDKHYQQFVNEFCGWKPPFGGMEAPVCNPMVGRVNFGEFRRACEAARGLWGLEGPCK